MVQGTGRHLISDKKKASGRLIDTQVCFLKACSDPLILRTAFGQSLACSGCNRLITILGKTSTLLKIIMH